MYVPDSLTSIQVPPPASPDYCTRKFANQIRTLANKKISPGLTFKFSPCERKKFVSQPEIEQISKLRVCCPGMRKKRKIVLLLPSKMSFEWRENLCPLFLLSLFFDGLRCNYGVQFLDLRFVRQCSHPFLG